MNHLPDLKAELVELTYDLLTEKRADELRARIANEPEVAKLYEEVLRKVSMIADASRVTLGTSLFGEKVAEPLAVRQREQDPEQTEMSDIELPVGTTHIAHTEHGRSQLFRHMPWEFAKRALLQERLVNRVMSCAAVCLVVLTICGYAYQRYQLSRVMELTEHLDLNSESAAQLEIQAGQNAMKKDTLTLGLPTSGGRDRASGFGFESSEATDQEIDERSQETSDLANDPSESFQHGSYSMRNSFAESQVRPFAAPFSMPQQSQVDTPPSYATQESQESEALGFRPLASESELQSQTSEPSRIVAPLLRNQRAADQNIYFPERSRAQSAVVPRSAPLMGSAPAAQLPAPAPVAQQPLSQPDNAQNMQVDAMRMGTMPAIENSESVVGSSGGPGGSMGGSGMSGYGSNMSGAGGTGMGGKMSGYGSGMGSGGNNRGASDDGDMSPERPKSEVRKPEALSLTIIPDRDKMSGTSDASLTITASATIVTQNDQTTWQIELQVTDALGQAVADADVIASIQQVPTTIKTVTIDNLAAVQSEYHRAIENTRQRQRSWNLTIGMIVIFGGMGLAVLSMILFAMRLASGMRMFVVATVSGLTCIFVCMVMLRGQSDYDLAQLKQSAKSETAVKSMVDSSANNVNLEEDVVTKLATKTDSEGLACVELVLPPNSVPNSYLVVEVATLDGQVGVFRSFLHVILKQEE